MREEYKNLGRKFIEPLTILIVKTKISPNLLTLLGIPFSIAAGMFFSLGNRWMGLVFLFLVALMDTIDGEVARKSQKLNPKGAFLDSVIDRFSEIFIYAGFFYYYLHVSHILSLLVFGTLSFSLMVSYIRARAEGIGKECKIGLMERPVRFAVLILGFLILGYRGLPYVLGLIFLGSFYTIIQRVMYVFK
ncbi:MAG: CDP-alcohol phosphatidyltransferase family protein [candidate division WOR-3 bacterium]|nr:CDP-alcohol phosphatidyltransferase family protein [candidate division WOR-3 bacterium]MCX7757741.1 CDP-alcohol phosphatidyltransferase family protein [candidate division WOR-3 bacterium]MDW7987825.1 CDP-alcohol phosphatidyltransferase family protein [candidate division WOR-3 bacterium]